MTWLYLNDTVLQKRNTFFVINSTAEIRQCIWPPSTADEAVFHGQSGPCYAAGGR